MRPSRIDRINAAARWIAHSPEQLRYDSFSALSDSIGVPKDVLKKDLWVLAYATENADIRKVPHYLQDAVRDLKRNADKIEAGAAKKAVDAFLMHSPALDMEERARKIVPRISDRASRMMRAYAEINYGTAEALAEVMGLPKARAVSMAWQKVGQKIHDELPRMRHLPPESLESLMLDNIRQATAKQQYEFAKVLTLRQIAERRKSAGADEQRRLTNLEKALRRVSFRAYPKKLKAALKRHYPALSMLAGKETDAARKKELERLKEIGRRLSVADRMWAKRARVKK